MKYQEIKEKRQKAYNDLFTECGVFWAFSNEQFKEGYAKVKPTMLIISVLAVICQNITWKSYKREFSHKGFELWKQGKLKNRSGILF